ncbi:long-chain-fatty-acid--CoA ligase 1 [Nephila pilipes]|uniref:Long-chain-fatty-acid--CoA ligase n=1 Tax=Nephila pilipes TaxID=299642 RepID=A0A8X6TCS8_NEPPI|nr:long-chain-fatty-acid--CoA ligase 1 [Nephila pilipes]
MGWKNGDVVDSNICIICILSLKLPVSCVSTANGYVPGSCNCEIEITKTKMDSSLQYICGSIAAAVTGAVATAAFYIATRPPPKLKRNFDLNSQSEELPGPDHVRISHLTPKAPHVSYLFEDAQTLHECMIRGARVSGNGPCLGWREIGSDEYQWVHYKEVLERAKNFGAGLLHKKLKPGSFVGIYSLNNVECVLTEYACYGRSMSIVPIYDTLGPKAFTLVVNEAEISAVICDKETKTMALINDKNEMPTLKLIVQIEPISDIAKKKAEEFDVDLISYKEMESLGKANPVNLIPPKPENLATICYTSGTTGSPKGVMLTHKSIVANVSAVMLQLGETAPGSSDTMLSFLPLAHMFERCCQIGLYMTGGKVGFFQGDIRKLNEDFRTLRPTVIPCVPRLLNRMYDKIQEEANSSKIKKMLINMAIESKKAELEKDIIRNNSVWDWTVLKPIQDKLGGRLRLIVVGSAPIAGHILTFLRSALGCVIVVGYGQTECVAPCTLTTPGDISVDNVGPPIPCCKVKLVDVPDMNYFASEGKGEVCVQGLTVFQGYLKDTEKTESTVDKDGWLHTGDIGMWLPNGALAIVDRKKHIFKLQQGEYVAPEKVENIYLRNSYVSQVFVHGDSLKSCVVGVIVPEIEAVLQWCKEQEITGEWNHICQNKVVKEHILEELIALGRKSGLKSFEQVKDIYLHPRLFTIEDGLLTPTLKTKRLECRKNFKPQIDAMYSHLV